MPFRGPGDTWYGEHATANEIYARASIILREGGAMIAQSDKIYRELLTYEGDDTPPWTDYGRRQQVDYVIVSQLMRWSVDKPTAVGYCPGEASLKVDVHSVAKDDVVYSDILDAAVGVDDTSTDIFTDSGATKKALIRLLLTEWKKVFVGHSSSF